MDVVTPQVLIDLFDILLSEDKKKFFVLLGRRSIAETVFVILNELSNTEQWRFTELIHKVLTAKIYPFLLQKARRFARDNPQLSDEEFDRLFREDMAKSSEYYERELRNLVRAQLKEERDRPSDPEIIKRNVQICDLRKKDSKKWSLGKLAQHFKRDKKTISDILKDEIKWRRLALEGGGTSSPTP